VKKALTAFFLSAASIGLVMAYLRIFILNFVFNLMNGFSFNFTI
jgi:hypothetical protein